MIILTVLSILLFIGIILCKSHSDILKFSGYLVTLLTACILLVSLITIPVCLLTDSATIVKIEATRIMIEQARINGSEIELAALQTKIIDTNQQIIISQYWNETIFGLWVHDDFMKLKLLK